MDSNEGVRVVALLGRDLQHRNTLATLVDSGVNVVGACFANDKKGGIPLKYIRASVKKRGLSKVISQVAARLIYLVRNRRLDAQLKSSIFDKDWCDQVLAGSIVKTLETDSYGSDEAMRFIESLAPDIIVVHTASWVPKKVRTLSTVKYVIGGHPGITPFYRGSHSPFWAIINNDLERIGWTVFLLDSGVDTGAVIDQGFLVPNETETFMSLSWRGMVEIARAQSLAVKEYESTGKIVAVAHESIPENTEYFNPTVREQLMYWSMQKAVR